MIERKPDCVFKDKQPFPLRSEAVEGLSQTVNAAFCFRCGVCCTKYQVRLSLVEARQMAGGLGLAWEEWIERYTDRAWPGIESFLLLQDRGRCVFLEEVKGTMMTRCTIQQIKPSSCREWQASLSRPDCQEGLAKGWKLTVNSSGQLEGSEEDIRAFLDFVNSLQSEQIEQEKAC